MLSLVAWPCIDCLLASMGSASAIVYLRLLRILRDLELDLIAVCEKDKLLWLLGLAGQRSIHLLLVSALKIVAFVARIGRR